MFRLSWNMHDTPDLYVKVMFVVHVSTNQKSIRDLLFDGNGMFTLYQR